MIDEEARSLDGIAIIGMSLRVPGAADLATFWRNLREGVESISFFSEEELLAAGVPPELLANPNYVRARGVPPDADLFDAAFFDLSPREAETMDPQHRLFLEHAWSALEHAGYLGETYGGAVGVFAGSNITSYLLNNLAPYQELIERVGPLQIRIRNDKDFLATLASYKLNLKGPSVNIQTACSTSLVAVCMASQSLLGYQCDMALAGGVSVSSPLKSGYLHQEGVYAIDGHCRAFDAGAQGTVLGDGIGVVVLKRLEDAIADGDVIHAVIKGFATNNDGSLKLDYTAPSVDGQTEVIGMAHAIGDIDPASIGYVEAHGTGTPLGDPIEIAALAQAFGAGTPGSCAIGSVKTNVGHLDAAAGVTSLIKVALALKHREIPPSLHFERPNPQIDFSRTPFRVNSKLSDWPAGEGPRRAGISSFGVGGTNAHVVLEEAPAPAPASPGRPWQLLVLSARSEAALDRSTANLAAHLQVAPGSDLADVAYTLQVGRKAFAHRRVLVCRDVEDAASVLAGGSPSRLLSGMALDARGGRERPVAFAFSGLGDQYAGMARGLYDAEPLFRDEVDHCCGLLRPQLGLDLREVLFAGEARTGRGTGAPDLRRMLGRGGPLEAEDAAPSRLDRTGFAHPALFTVEHALARLLMSWGIRPGAMIGYSLGEYVAACVAGVLSLEDALYLVAERARLIEDLPEGAMLAIPRPEAEVAALLGNELSLAAVNGSSFCVAAGPVAAVEALAAQLASRDVVCRRLRSLHAFHSRMLEPAVDAFTRAVARIELRPPQIPFVSNVTGTWIMAAQATDPRYWAEHMCRTVRFGDGLETLWEEPERLLLEVGPGQALTSIALQSARGAGGERLAVPSLPHSHDDQPDQAFLLGALGRLWLAGAQPDWNAFQHGRRRRVDLPTYPFERKRYWIDPPPRSAAAVRAAERSAAQLQRVDVGDWFYLPSWRQVPPPAAVAAAPQTWLLFLQEELGAGLRAELERCGHEVVAVRAGARFARTEPGEYELRPGSAGDYEELVGALAGEGRLPGTAVHLWNVAGASAEPGEVRDLAFFSLIFLAQAWSNRASEAKLRLFVVTSGVCSVTGEEELAPERALVLGPCRVIPQESAQIACGHVDLPSRREGAERWVSRLLAELEAPAEGTIALRGPHRWTQGFEPLRLELPDEAGSRLRRDGVYLITGGLGGIGLALAEHLARTVRARLALVGRSELPPRERWGEILVSDPGSETAAKVRGLTRLEALTPDLLALAGDVTSAGSMEGVRRAVLERFGRLDGVVHAAGVSPGGLVQLKTREAASAVLEPKLAGAGVLEQVFWPEDGAGPDFLLLCSSLTAVTGTLGLVDHCAANAFLDAFAHDRRLRRELPVTSVNWDTWLEVGQAARAGFASQLDEVLDEDADGPAHPLLHRSVLRSEDREIWSSDLAAADWVLDEHRFLNRGLMPGTAYLEMARAAFARHRKDRPVVFRDVHFSHPLMIPDGEARRVHTMLSRRSGESFELVIASREDGASDWTEHVRGRIEPGEARREASFQLEGAEAGWAPRALGHDLQSATVRFGPRWRGLIRELRTNGRQGWALLDLPAEYRQDLDRFELHPALLDAASGMARILAEGVYVPLGYRSITVHGPLPATVQCRFQVREEGGDGGETLLCDATILDAHGGELVAIEGYALRRIADPLGFAEGDRNGGGLRRRTVPAEEIAPAGPHGPNRHGILPAQGGGALARLSARSLDQPQVLVSTRDLPAAIAQARELTGARVAEHLDRLRSRQVAHPRPNVRTAYAAPRSLLEERLAALFHEMLGIDEVGVHDNFFDLGGNSLVATQMISRLRGEHGVGLSLRSIFESPTVAELAGVLVQQRAEQVDPEELASALGEIDPEGGGIATLPPERLGALWDRLQAFAARAGGAEPAPVVPLPRDGREALGLPLSFAQQRLWFVSQLAPESSAYNIATAVRLRGPLRVAAMEQALNDVIARHESLRTTFAVRGEQPVQVIASSLTIPLLVADLSGLPADLREAEAQRQVLAEAEAPYDLERGPLLRGSLLRLGPGEHLLLLNVHHIVSDKGSQDVLIEELAALYGGHAAGRPAVLPELPVQYADFARWQLEWLQGEVLERQLAYWKQRLEGAPSGLELPNDRPRPSVQTYRGDRQPVALSREMTTQLEAFSQREGATLFMTLFAAFNVLMHQASRQLDVVLGTTISGRSRMETERLIGFFVNNLVLRTDLSGNPTFRELLRRVRDVLLSAHAHQDLPFERLVAELRIDRDPGRHPLFQVMFNVQDLPVEGVELAGLEAEPLEPYAGRVKFDLTVFLLTLRRGLTGAFVYNRDLFEPATMARWAEDFESILRLAVAQPESRLEEMLAEVAEDRRRKRAALRGEIKQENVLRLGAIKRKAIAETKESVS